MSDVFISYSSEDRERIIPLVQLLEAQGWSVWWDRTIFPGKTFDEAIQEAIDEARCVMVVWSNASVRSRWVKTEAAEGDRRGILVPAQLDPCQLPLEFRRVQAAQLMGWRGGEDNVELQRLLGAISEILGGRTPPPEHLGEQALSACPNILGTHAGSYRALGRAPPTHARSTRTWQDVKCVDRLTPHSSRRASRAVQRNSIEYTKFPAD